MKNLRQHSTLLAMTIMLLISSLKPSHAQNWAQLGNGVPQYVQASCMSGDSLILAYSTSTWYGFDDTIQVAIWNGSFYSNLPEIVVSALYDSLIIHSISVYNGEIYLAGSFDSVINIPGTKDIIKWNGSQWESVGGGVDQNGSYGYYGISHLEIFDNKLYASGEFISIGGVSASTVAYWDGTSWNSIGFPSGFSSYTLQDMKALGGFLYITGYFSSIGSLTTQGIAKWDGAIWSDVGGGFGNQDNGYRLGIYNGDLFVNGGINLAGTTAITNGIARWDGSSWYDDSNGLSSYNNVYGFAEYNNELWACGYFYNGTSYDYLVKWNGTTWSILQNDNPAMSNILSNGSSLYGTGWFNYYNNVTYNNVALWCDGSNCGLITGKVYNDANGNCTQDIGDFPIIDSHVIVGNAYTTTDSNGNYSIYISPGSYSVTHTPLTYWVPACPVSNSINVNVSVGNPATGIDFGDSILTNIQDLAVTMTSLTGWIARVDSDVVYSIHYSNIGTMTMDGYVELHLDPNVVYLSSNPNPDNVTGNVYTWNFTNLLPNESHSITFTVHIPGSLVLHSYLNDTVYVFPMNNDLLPANNTSFFEQIVGNAWDPNDKQVMPAGTGANGDITVADSVLTYHIDFQNTGNAVAHNVVILDTLSQDVQPLSVAFGSHSHAMNFDLNNPGILQINFPNIELPDSGSNEAGSHGFVEYTVHLKPNLPLGTQITNTASIYFDFNQPIQTNTTLNTLTDPNSVPNISSNGTISVFPNPSNEVFTVHNASSHDVHFTITNAIGQVIYSAELDASGDAQLSTRQWPAGAYFVSNVSNAMNASIKLVVQH